MNSSGAVAMKNRRKEGSKFSPLFSVSHTLSNTIIKYTWDNVRIEFPKWAYFACHRRRPFRLQDEIAYELFTYIPTKRHLKNSSGYKVCCLRLNMIHSLPDVVVVVVKTWSTPDDRISASHRGKGLPTTSLRVLNHASPSETISNVYSCVDAVWYRCRDCP